MDMTLEPDPETKIITDATRSRYGSTSSSMSYRNLDAEKVLKGFGTFGAYQMLVYAMANAGYFLYACESMIFSLITEEPEFKCDSPEGFNTTLDECKYFNSEMNTTSKCSSFSYAEGKHAYLTSEFDLVCDNAHYGEYSMSLYMLGTMLFTPILTQLADLYGRRMMFLIPLWLAILANIGCVFAPNQTVFMIFIFISGIGATGLGTVGFVIMLETIAPAFRSYTPLVSTVVWVAGYTTVGIVHMYIESWRWQFLVLVAPFLLTFSYYWLFPESIHWLITYNKTTQVESWIKTSAKFNRRKLNLDKCKNSVPSTRDENSERNNHRRTFLDIFSNGPMVFQLASHCYIMMVLNFTYWALSFFSTDLHENKMMGYFLSGFVELPAAGGILLLAYFGRRTVTSLGLLAQSVAMCVAVFYPGKNLISMTLFLLVKGFNSVVWVAEPLLVGEMAPTSTRNMFYGFIAFVGEIGSITAPYFNRLKTIHELAPAIAVAFLSLTAGLLALCSPETMNVSMPEDIGDFDPGPVYSWLFKPRRKGEASNVEIGSSKQILNICTTISCVCPNVEAVTQCYDIYMQSYNLSSNPLPSYNAYKGIRDTALIQKGPQGQTTECHYADSLMDCLWELEPDCITIDQFRQYFNVDSSEATQYVLDYFMTKYKCNQGYKDVMKHFYCIEEVGLYKTGDLIKCEKSLQSALGNNRGCADYNTYVTCLIDVFTKYCESGIKNYICNLKVNGIIDAIPDCKGQLQTCPDQGFKFHLPIGRLHKVQQAKRVLKTGHYIFP